MIKKISKILIYIFLFTLTFMLFLPKESLYNLIEKELEKKQIIISNELRNESLFNLDISRANIYFEGINISNFDKLEIFSYFYFTKVEVQNITILDSLSSFAPSPINNISFNHSILNFNKILINSNGAFGELKGEFNIFTNTLKIELIASKEMKNSYSKLLRNMKLENERYIYEYKF